MSLVRLLPAWLHAIADYAVALSLIVVALVVGGPAKVVAPGVVIGAVVLVVSMLTRYPLGVIKVLPFKVHSAGDYLAVILLVTAPFALGFTHSARGLSIFYVGAGVAVLLVSLITNYQYSPKGQALTAHAAKGRSKRDPSDLSVDPAPRPALQPSYTPQAGPPSYTPQAGPQSAPVDQSWRTASWQTRALVDPQGTTAPPAAAAQPPAVQPTVRELATAEVVPVAPAQNPTSEPGRNSRPLREILAERAANRNSAA